MKQVDVAAIYGDRVYITEIESYARVKSVSIGHGGAQYELSWFSNGDLKTGWFMADQFEERA